MLCLVACVFPALVALALETCPSDPDMRFDWAVQSVGLQRRESNSRDHATQHCPGDLHSNPLEGDCRKSAFCSRYSKLFSQSMCIERLEGKDLNLSPGEFQSRYVQTSRPVVFSKLLTSQPGRKSKWLATAESWSHEQLLHGQEQGQRAHAGGSRDVDQRRRARDGAVSRKVVQRGFVSGV